jgi:hypothetical protein
LTDHPPGNSSATDRGRFTRKHSTPERDSGKVPLT